MTLALLYLVYLVLPGFLLASALGRRRHLFLLSVSLSFGFLACAVHVAALLGWEHVNMNNVGAAGALGGAVAYTVALLRKRRTSGLTGGYTMNRSPSSGIGRLFAAPWKPVNLGAIAVAVAAAVYCAWVGAYTEVPSDAWRHLEQVRTVVMASEGHAVRIYPIAWYTIQAWLWNRAGYDVYGFMQGAGLVNTVLCLLAVYFFALYVFRRLRATKRTKVALAIAAVILFALHQGLSVFAFIRYYAFGPAIINIVLYFAAIGVLWELIERRRHAALNAAILAALVAVVFATHKQEALFIGVVGPAMLAVNLWRRKASGNPGRRVVNSANPESVSTGWRDAFMLACLFLVATAGLGVFLYSRYHYALMGSLRPWVIPLQDILPFVRHLYIANPTYQVFQAIGLFGIAVYLLAFLYRERIKKNDYLVAGMFVPALTLFNPVFVDVFVRHYHPSGIYRFSYAIPFAFVGAQIIFELTTKAKGCGWIAQAQKYALAALPAFLLFPVHTTYFESGDSRVYTLGPVRRDNDYAHWKDLFDYLNTLEKKRKIITDPVTRYLISGLTRHRAAGWKFYTAEPALTKLGEYNEATFDRYGRWLLIVNERDGGHSENGARSKHWRADVLKTSGYYGDALRTFVAGHPELFVEKWRRDRITVYEIGGGS